MRGGFPIPPTISGSLFSTKANMEDPNMQHLIDEETRRELYRINYDLALIRRRSWFLYFIPLIWFKLMFGTINVNIKEQPVKEVATAPAKQIAPLDQFVFNTIAWRLDNDLQFLEEKFFGENFWDDENLEK